MLEVLPRLEPAEERDVGPRDLEPAAHRVHPGRRDGREPVGVGAVQHHVHLGGVHVVGREQVVERRLARHDHGRRVAQPPREVPAPPGVVVRRGLGHRRERQVVHDEHDARRARRRREEVRRDDDVGRAGEPLQAGQARSRRERAERSRGDAGGPLPQVGRPRREAAWAPPDAAHVEVPGHQRSSGIAPGRCRRSASAYIPTPVRCGSTAGRASIVTRTQSTSTRL